MARGYDVGYLTGPVAGGREGYYTSAVDAGEPPGLWYGAGAELLGLSGEVDADLMEAVYSHLLDPRDDAAHSRAEWGHAAPLAKAHRNYRDADEVYAELLETEPAAGPERRAELRAKAEQSARKALCFIDATFNAPKSVTVLSVAFERAANEARAAGDHETAAAMRAHHEAVEAAVMAGARAAVDYLQDAGGYSRAGRFGGGSGRWVDAHRFVVAQFLQHDSRNRDPHLHVHQAILNRVLCDDGVWRTLDSSALHRLRGAASAIGERVMEAYLTRTLGVRFGTEPDGQSRAVLGVARELIELFSSRRHEITGKAAELLDAYRQRMGREPSAIERTKIYQQATLATRASKRYGGESLDERLDRWEAETRSKLAVGLSQVARDVLGLAQEIEAAEPWSVRDVVLRALAEVGDRQQTWSRSDLMRHVSNALPGHLDLAPGDVRPLLERLTDAAEELAVVIRGRESTESLPADRRLANGASCFEPPCAATFATPEQVAAERELRRAAVLRGAFTFSSEAAAGVVGLYARAGYELGADQAAAVRGVMTSGARVETLNAAAGTGKSFVVGALNEAWRGVNRHAFGLATSQVATEVLSEEGLDALNITRWLDAQRRMERGNRAPDDDRWRLQPGDLVVVDEAGMTDTAALVEINERCQGAGAKLLLVGDPHQLAAVGAGGTLADLSEHGVRYELAEVRRFRAPWEASASLRLRAGDVEVLDEYVKHGRILDSGSADQAENEAARAWLADTLAGRESLALVGTNEAAARLSARLRGELVKLGEVSETGVPLGLDGTVAGVGDLVQARRNGWSLIGHDGNDTAPLNRRCYRVREVRPDGSLVVTRDGSHERTMTLPPEYVAQHVALGYASTVHAAEGRTVDTAHVVVGTGTDAPGAYVALTRGRERNTAYCITESDAMSVGVNDDGNAVPGEAPAVARTGRAVLADILAAAEDRTAEESALTQARLADVAARSVQIGIDRLSDDVEAITAARTATTLDQLAADGVLSDEHRTALAADPALSSVHTLLRSVELAGHDPAAVLSDVLNRGSLDGAHYPARVVHSRVTEALRDQLTPGLTCYGDLVPADAPAERRQWLADLADSADQRRYELGARVADERPQWALEALGPVPDDVIDREEWESRAGWAAAYRELTDFDDTSNALGAAPPRGLPEKHAAWQAAHTALGLSEPGDVEAGMDEGPLRVRARAYERELQWAPRWVGDELAATNQAADRARADAELTRAQAEAAPDETERERLLAVADEAAAAAAGLAEQVAQLDVADEARGGWYAETAATREAAARARAKLAERGIDLDDPQELVTAAEWLEAHREAEQAEAAHREVRDETELHDAEREAALAAVPVVEGDASALETAVPDVRETSARDATEDADPADRRRVPSADETTAAVRRAQQALAELAARQAEEAAQADDEAARSAQLNEWARSRQAAADERRAAELHPVLEP